ncbi:MAG: tRNA (adenosine(37)-N6)-threonylcarbamoyltransferase complex ATPase subunit type 1 TsaE [Bacteroidota bacterium]|jgi:tRNA threonylcarbamoyladenosine biosynthesis protein TsaE
MHRIVTHSEDETIAEGERFAGRLKPGDVVALFGDLGSGKTRFTKGISRGLGVHEQVTSPTFVVVNEHRGGRYPLYHFDFYRMRSVDELQEIGFEEYLYGSGVCIIEWAEMVERYLPAVRYDVSFELGSTENERTIMIEERQ